MTSPGWFGYDDQHAITPVVRVCGWCAQGFAAHELEPCEQCGRNVCARCGGVVSINHSNRCPGCRARATGSSSKSENSGSSLGSDEPKRLAPGRGAPEPERRPDR